MSIELFEKVGNSLNAISSPYNFRVNPRALKGASGKNNRAMREYRLQLIDQNKDTSKTFIPALNNELKKMLGIKNIKFNQISPNSSKFSSYSFELMGNLFDVVIAKGANAGEKFESKTVNDLKEFFNAGSDSSFKALIELMNAENKDFASVEIVRVSQRTGSTLKTGVPIEQLNKVIGDIILKDSTNRDWYISLKDINGNTFSSYPGASTLFNARGDLQPNSEAASFLLSFGADLNEIQKGFDLRNNIKTPRSKYKTSNPNTTNIKNIFERAWGMNYFYVRRMTNGWKVFWLDRNKLNKLTSNIVVDRIRYPDRSSKQISIFCSNNEEKYLIEIRNSKGGEYPNDIKIKTLK